MRFSLSLAYLFSYNLLQFYGHTWIFTNMTARFLSFGEDAQAGTFYFVGVMMGACQLLSLLELFHIADGFEGISILHMLPYLSESEGKDSVQLKVPASIFIYSPYILMGWLLLLVLGSSLTVLLLLKERKEDLESWNKKLKKD
ncbi:very-long-chain (3R)-3-hydroxyacyl-CoA dehydratase 4-like [Sinocyclocheilus grahami]|uniref:very-long-chain (3R)-3-hydroxyacyl-CoA dehydratase 4-like n=1 Tax=Sinocyclocheilus grahami TaxID=75366 RepID=UPI0007AD510A|nr:PREDICTED: very-long-chain (3R)-3-hydroxyacyl-CoA dehydratase 4-like [Sinocyclocheilus grahami]